MTSNKRKTRKNSIILWVLFCTLVCYFVATLISLHTRVKAEEQSLEALKNSYQEQLDENSEIQMVIDGGDEADYIERVARERYGYAKPDERVYYDSSAS